MGLDLNKDYNSAKSKISAYGTVIDNKKNTALKQKEKVKSSVDKKKSDVVNQINELKSGTNDIKNQIKSQVKDQLEELLDIFKTTLNSKTSKYKSMSSVVEFFLKAAENTKPRIKEILIDEIVTMIGCSEEQSYNDMVFSQNQQGQKLYIKVSQVDLFKKLQLGPDDEKAKYFYEDTETPPGYLPFSCNRDLYNRLQTGQSISQQTGSDYLGESGQALFDIKYVTSYIPPTGPPIPVTGDFFEIELKNQINNRTSVSDFLRDYYGTLDILDFNILSAELMNTLTGVFDFSMGISSDELREQKKFDLILKRIMGICNDPTKKIDVQGTAKLPELDNIDDSFFDISNQELRNIEAQINNTLQGNVEFEGCDGIILPIPVKATLENLDDIIKENKGSGKVEKLQEGIDNMVNNPEWKVMVPKLGLDINLKVGVEGNIIVKLPRVVFKSILTPKVMLGLLIMVKAIKNKASEELENLFDNINDFMKSFKKFTVEFMRKITAIFIQELFKIIKKNIKQLVETILLDIINEAKNKQLKMYAAIIYVLFVLVQAFVDFRNCKSVIDEILKLLNLALSQLNLGLPLFALAGAQFLSGVSSIRAFSNVIENLQKQGLPTGDLPDGSPNLMNMAMMGMIDGQNSEMAENGKVEMFIPSLQVTPYGTLPTKGSGKFI
jgi:hypothetical protein